jgi:hypothetical protein
MIAIFALPGVIPERRQHLVHARETLHPRVHLVPVDAEPPRGFDLEGSVDGPADEWHLVRSEERPRGAVGHFAHEGHDGEHVQTLHELGCIGEVGRSVQPVVEEAGELYLAAVEAAGLVEAVDPGLEAHADPCRDGQVPVAPHDDRWPVRRSTSRGGTSRGRAEPARGSQQQHGTGGGAQQVTAHAS